MGIKQQQLEQTASQQGEEAGREWITTDGAEAIGERRMGEVLGLALDEHPWIDNSSDYRQAFEDAFCAVVYRYVDAI